MTTNETSPLAEFARAASQEQVARAAAALSAHGFAVEVLRDAGEARTRVRELVPAGASVLTASSETLRASGIDEDINGSGRYLSVREAVQSMDRSAKADDIRRLAATPDVIVGSVAAVTETGSLIVASASGSQLPAYSGGAPAIWIIGAQKIVPDMSTALRRLEEYALPREDERAQRAYGQPSAVNFMLTLNAEPRPGRATVLLLQEAIGF
ncbi:LUD domain-containing protein [Brevibacterium oceani]|uniref:LUD domain-containing protein n=1 Tax=Brevibacterium oceani TaxID=358099 RepID=UPI001B32B7BA|nr:LUD domain-containing protein [Brevibacterium oceani]